MDANAWIAIIALAFSVISGGAAVWSWWEANRSTRARKGAEDAATLARRAVEAAEQSAAGVSNLVDRFTPEPLEVNWINHGMFEIRNTQDESVEIEELINAEEFSSKPFKTPVIIEGGKSIRGVVSAKYSAGPFPLEAVLKIRERPEESVLRFTGRPAKS